MLYTVGENIIATTKIRNNYGAIQSFIFPILHPFWQNVFGFFFDCHLSKVILVILRAVEIVGRLITIWEAIQKRSHEPNYKTYTKIEAKKLRATTFAIAMTNF